MIEPQDRNIILELIREFEILNQQTDLADTTAIEKQKLHIIKAFEAIIKKQMPLEYTVKPLCKQDSTFAINQTFREILYCFLLVFGMFESVAGNYMFGSTLFALIPGISNPVLLVASIAFTVLSSVLFYAFEVTFLKDALGIHYTNTDVALLVEIYTSQLKTAISINQLLATIHMQEINNSVYDEYIQLTNLVNQDLRIKHETIGPYPESSLKKILKIGILAFGALSSIAGSYFFANALLTVLAVSLVGTPVGWAIIGLTILAGLGFYYAMDATSMIRLANPAFDKYHTLKKELQQFKDIYHDDLSLVRTIKDRFIEKKPTQDMCTQTEQTQSSFNQSGLQFFGHASANDARDSDSIPANTSRPTRAHSF